MQKQPEQEPHNLTTTFSIVAYRLHEAPTWHWGTKYDSEFIHYLVEHGHAIMVTRRDEDRFTLLVKLAAKA